MTNMVSDIKLFIAVVTVMDTSTGELVLGSGVGLFLMMMSDGYFLYWWLKRLVAIVFGGKC